MFPAAILNGNQSEEGQGEVEMWSIDSISTCS